MNILFLINHAGKGGSEKYVYELASRLVKTDTVFFAYNEEGDLVKKMTGLNITPNKVIMKSPFDFDAINIIADFCKNNKIDIIHTQFPRENYIALFVKMKIKKIKVINTTHLIVENNILWKIFNKLLTRNNSVIIAVCNKVKETLIKNSYPEEKIKVIYNGVPYKPYIRDMNNSTIREELEIEENMFLFVTLARFSEEKGLLYFLESIKLLTTLIESKFRVLMVGDGELLNVLKQYVKDNNIEEYVIFTGYRTDTDNILMGCDCYINSSITEALSFAILEAMSKALPIIATKVGGNPDIINEETRCGILVRYGSTIHMARSMEKMIDDKEFYDICIENSTKAIKDKFNIEENMKETINLYKNI